MLMTQKFTYGDCYKVLNTRAGCSWSELRKAYKVQIQKWHPDRFKDGSTKKEAAEEKIKVLNAAYQQLSKYYKKHNALPAIEPVKEKVAPKPKVSPKKQQPAEPAKAATHKPETKIPADKEKKKPVFIVIIVISAFIYAGIKLVPEDQQNNAKQEISHLKNTDKLSSSNTAKIRPSKQTTDILSSNKKTRAKDKINPEDIIFAENEEFFTYGSSIGEVISIQGPPTKTRDDVWHYGKSKVYFHEGMVIRWKRSPGDPIKAGLLLPKIKKDTKSKTDKARSPLLIHE